MRGFFFRSIMEETKTISPRLVESWYQQLEYNSSLPSYSELFLLSKTILFLILYVSMKQTNKNGLSNSLSVDLLFTRGPEHGSLNWRDPWARPAGIRDAAETGIRHPLPPAPHPQGCNCGQSIMRHGRGLGWSPSPPGQLLLPLIPALPPPPPSRLAATPLWSLCAHPRAIPACPSLRSICRLTPSQSPCRCCPDSGPGLDGGGARRWGEGV